MIIEKDGLRIQRPIVETNWLYIDDKDTRIFVKEASLGKESEPLSECTNEEKEVWEREHLKSIEVEQNQEGETETNI